VNQLFFVKSHLAESGVLLVPFARQPSTVCCIYSRLDEGAGGCVLNSSGEAGQDNGKVQIIFTSSACPDWHLPF